MSVSHPDRVIAELASAQHGVVARRQLLEAGIGREAIQFRIGRSRLFPLSAGVYAVGHVRVARCSLWMAAVLASGPRAVLSHRSAAALWGILGDAGRIDVTSAKKLRPIASVRRHRSVLPEDEVGVKDAIPVTSPNRTIFDLAGTVRDEQLHRSIREAAFLRLYDVQSLPRLLDRHRGHRGNAQLRRCLEELGAMPAISRNVFEDRFARFIARNRLPRPRVNAHVEVGDRAFEVDCVWERHRVAVELDGREAHGTRAAFESDRERDRRLQAAGWTVVRVTWRQLSREPDQLRRDLKDVLARGNYKRM
jgi:very-short-patch-repair endonuclease